MLAWRRTRPQLVSGAMELLAPDDAVLAFVRRGADGRGLLCAFNLSPGTARYALPPALQAFVLDTSHPLPSASRPDAATLVIPPCGAAYAAL